MADNDTPEVKEEAPVETEAAVETEAKETPAAPETKVEQKQSEPEKPVEAIEEKNAEKKKDLEVPKEFASLVKELDKLSALEISKFVKFLEQYWGVSAAAPAAVVAVTPSTGSDAAAAEADQKSEFDVILKDPGAQKVAVIKAVKDVTGLGLGEAKAIVDGAPGAVKEKVSKDEAEAAKKALEAAGATVELV